MAHSADADDVFMWWPLGQGGADPPVLPSIPVGQFRFAPFGADIEQLNRRAVERGDLDVTALSVRAYAEVADRYVISAAGCSMGEGYGPKIVSARPLEFQSLLQPGIRLAVPGERTTAYLALRLLLGGTPNIESMPFDAILAAVRDGRADAGLLIHEGQLLFAREGLSLVADLGELWASRTGLPLPLGVNALRRDLDERMGPGALRQVAGLMEASVRYALDHRAESLSRSRSYARIYGGLATGMTDGELDRYISLYVNRWTLDAGPAGEMAIERLLREGAARGYCPDPGPIRLARGDAE